MHEVQVRSAWGGELEGSPLAWEARRPDAPARSFLLRGAADRLEDGATVRFDPAGRSVPFCARDEDLLQNREEIGGLREHRKYQPWPSYLARFERAYVDAAFGGVYRTSGEIWQGSTYLLNTWAQQRAQLQMLAGRLAAAPGDTCLLFCNSVKETYFHWHLDCLAGLVMARDLAGGEAVAIGPPLNSWQRASLDLLGETVVEISDACQPNSTLVPCHVDGRGIYPDRWVVRLFDRLRKARQAERGPQRRRSRRLFISRRDAGHRVLANEDALWAALETKGFERFIPGEVSYREQVDAFSEAEVVVASHGSALTNIGFCRRGATVVEILPSNYVNGCFRYLAIALGLRHGWWTTDRLDPFEVEVEPFMDWCAANRLV